MAGYPVLETARLILRPLEVSDATTAQRLFPHWEIVRYMNARIPWPYPADGAIRHYKEVSMPAIAAGRAFSWSIRLRSTDEMIGAIDLFLESEDEHRGFWLGLPWQRRGLMTEASDRVTDFWFDHLNRPVLRVPKAACNLASRRVSERCGMRVVGKELRPYVCGELEGEIWEITKEEWHAYRSAAIKN